MIFRFFMLLTGFGLAVAGGVSMIAYLNLLAVGYDFYFYLTFISKTVEFYIMLVGIATIWTSIYFPVKK